MRSLRFTAVLALSALAACGGGASSPTDLHNQGIEQRSAGDFDAAIASFRSALDGADAELAVDVRKDLANALCHTDPSEAADEFMALVEEHGDALNERDYMDIGKTLKDNGAFEAATVVVDAGIKRIGEAPKLNELIAMIAKEAASAGDSAAMAALEGLGYVGD